MDLSSFNSLGVGVINKIYINSSNSATSFKNISFIFTGFFKPDTTNFWRFSLKANDRSYLWIGDNANNSTIQNADVQSTGGTYYSIGQFFEINKLIPIKIIYG
jgi:hypothetical protein